MPVELLTSYLPTRRQHCDMSTKDQTLSAELYGEALRTARRSELQPLINHLRDVARGRDAIRTRMRWSDVGRLVPQPLTAQRIRLGLEAPPDEDRQP